MERHQPWPLAKGLALPLRCFALLCLTALLAHASPAKDPAGDGSPTPPTEPPPTEKAGDGSPTPPTEPPPTEKARGFVFTAPKRLLAESNETLCLTLHNIPGSGQVNVDLLHADSDEKIASLHHILKPGHGSCMEMYIPQNSQIKGRLHVKAHFDEVYDYTINSVKEIYIDQNPHLYFIETDKPVYKPGQEVKFRLMTVNHNLAPVKGSIEKVWLENPSRVRMAQWLDVPTELGLAQLHFQLSPEPVQGMWTIWMQKSKDHTAKSKKFEVKEYVLPKFEVIIKPPNFVLADFKEITWKVCAKYSYGKPVKGEVIFKATPQLAPWRIRPGMELPKAERKSELGKKDGCFNFTVKGEEIGLLDWELSPEVILVNASVKEMGTDDVQSESIKTQVYNRAFKLEFLPHSLKYFKPGLPYKGKLRVLQPDNTPVGGEEIQLCLKVNERFHWGRTLVECKYFTSNSDGFVEFIVPPQDRNVTLLLLSAAAVRYQTTFHSPNKRWRVFMHQPSEFFDVESWYSPSDSYLEVADWDDKVLECNSRHLVNVYFTTDENVTSMEFSYLVKSRGDIVQYGHKVHQPSKRNHQELIDFPNILGVNPNVTNKEKNKTKKIMDKFSLKLRISPKMSPISDLLVYYVREDGETVATSHTMKIEKCFTNEVKAEWSDTLLYPGSQSKFKIEATPKSLCAVTAVDKSVSFFGTQNQIDIANVFEEMERFRIDPWSPPRQADSWEYCDKQKPSEVPASEKPATPEEPKELPMEVIDEDLRRKKRYVIFGPTSKYVDAIKAFDDVGLLVISDAKLHTRPCVEPIAHIHDWCNPCPFLSRRFESAHVLRGMARRIERVNSLTHTQEIALAQASPLSVSNGGFGGGALNSIVYDSASTSAVVEVRSFFPETWLWDLVHTKDDGTAEIESEVPHTITDWIGQATCLSSKTGLGTSLPSKMTAFQPFFLEATMPYSVKRGEVLRLKVSIFNFLSDSLPVKITIEHSQGLEILGNDTSGYCVEESGNFVTEFRLKMTELGEVNITVSAEIDETFPAPCGPEVLISRRDVIIKPIIVKPEGYPVELTNSSFVCASESEEVILYWNLELPGDLVEGSARAEISTMGDLLGPTLENLDGLVQLPMGCGEQNMILFVPNIHVLNYLESTNQVKPVLRAKAITNMEKGYQRELIYRHKDGSYSAFGQSDAEGSMWLTAFVVKSFAQARKFIFVDKEDLKISMRWITKRQLENGCFPFVGKVFHKDIKGGLSGESSSAAFSAYVLTALLETGIEMSPSVLSNALYCITAEDEASGQSPDMYTLALTTYALALSGPNQTEKAEKSLSILLEMATKEKDLLWWNKPGTNSLGMNVEITAYAVLSLVKLGGEENLIHAFQAVRWISQQRNSRGGFVSTQDTVVALEALSKYATVFMDSGNGKNTNLNIYVKTVDFDHTFVITDEERLLLHHREIPMLPTGVEVTASGTGCALVQTSLKYNVKTAKGSDAFDIEVKTSPSIDSCIMQKLEICTRYKLTDENSNMAVMEIDMISGYVPMKETLDKLKEDPTLNLKRWEESNNQVNLYFDEISTMRTCIRFLVHQESKVENPKPATVKVYDYYEQELSVSTNYNFPGDCEQERLPNPLPGSFDNDFGGVVIVDTPAKPIMEEMKTATSIVEGSKGVLKVNGSNIPAGLNPAFVNVDHDLEFPDGMEGTPPIYTSPQADSSRHHNEKDECPLCLDSPPDNFAKIYCTSRNAYKVAVRKFLNAKILMAMSPGRRSRKLNKQIMFSVKRSCSCIHLYKAGGYILVINVNDGSFNEDRPNIRIGSSTLVIPIPQSPGQPSIIRSARSSCK